MSRRARSLGWLVVLVAFGVAIASGLPAGEPQQGKSVPGNAPAKIAPGGIIVSRETTFITGPLRKDGTVDYLAALNQRYSQGVTPDNNAAVLLFQALGPAEILKPHRERFFERLGIAPLPEKGAYLEGFTAYFKRKSPGPPGRKEWQERDISQMAYDELSRITDRPWSKKDSPIGAAWLEENQEQIDLVVAASKRPRFYAPYVTGRDGPGTFIALLLPVVQPTRDAAHALRAGRRSGSGRASQRRRGKTSWPATAWRGCSTRRRRSWRVWPPSLSRVLPSAAIRRWPTKAS